jgi:hypothetical protein
MASRRVFFAISWLLAGSLCGAIGCFPPDEGRSVPLDKIYFPVGIQVSPGKKWMYVANSDFDLQFNAGTLQVYDLVKLRSRVPKYCNADSECADDGLVCDTDAQGTGLRAPTHRCLDARKRNPCASAGEKTQTAADQVLTPGLCTPVEPAPLLYGGVKRGVVSIGAFATDLLYAPNPLKDGKGSRLFIPVRGDATVHWITVDDDTTYPDQTDHSTRTPLECGQSGPSQACDQNHRRGTGNDSTTIADTAITLPAEPYGIALQARPYGGVPDASGSQFVDNVPAFHADFVPAPLSSFSETLVTTHQTTGQVALFVNTWSTGAPNADDGPQLVSVSGATPPTGALALASVPLPGFWLENPGRVTYLPSYLMTFTDAAQVSLVRAFDDAAASPKRPFIDTSRSIAITTNASGFESRGIAVDNSARRSCEAPLDGTCSDAARAERAMKTKTTAETRADCLLLRCETTPVGVYTANRSPATLIIGQTPPNVPNSLTDDLPRFFDSIPMSTGPSRVFVGDVIDTTGALSPRVFIICFDSRRIFVYNPGTRSFETEIATGRGPHAFALDVDEAPEPTYAYAYVGHFSDSYIGVIDLDQRHTSAYGTIVLSVGQRTPPRASK